MLFSTMFIVLVLAACGDDTTEEEPVEDTTQEEVKEAEDQDDMEKMMEGLNFDEIEIDISNGEDKEYEFEVDYHDNGDIKAKVEDEINNEKIDDDIEVFNYIYPNLTKLEIEKDTDKDEIIKRVLVAFELEDDYEKLDIEIRFGNDKVSI